MSFNNNIGKPSVDAKNDQCEMVNVHHPDCTCASCKMGLDVQCLEPYVGTVPENTHIRVCGACAVQTEREDFTVAYRPETRFVIVHPEMGIFLGGRDLDVSRWSKVNPTGQLAAITFRDRAQAEQVMASWGRNRPDKLATWPVIADHRVMHGDPMTFATADACVAAGLPGWDLGQADYSIR